MSDAGIAEGPWTKYQQQAPAAEGPWTKYQSAAAPATQEQRQPFQGTGIGIIDRAIDRVMQGGNLLGLPGPSALQQSAQISAERPYRPGIKMGEMIGPNTIENPMVWAFGPANIGVAGTAAGAPRMPMAGPRMAAPQQRLAAGGVQMTPGQSVGGIAKGFEDIATSFPLLGHWIGNARERSIKSFNEATLNQALEPIGRRVPKTVEMGSPAIKWAGSKASQAIGDVLGKIPSVAFDPELKIALNDIATQARANPKVWSQFEPILQANVQRPFANAGRLEGKEIQQIGSDLMRRARGYRGSQSFDDRELGAAFSRMARSLYDAIERQYPAEAPALQSARNTWAMLTRIEQASGRRATSEGIFTPADLLAASRAQAGGVRRGGAPREFVQGDALFQKWGQAAQRVLPSKIPDSGTPSRLLAHDLIGATTGLGGAVAAPQIAIPALAGYAAAGIPYIPPISRGIQRYMGGTPSRTGAATRAAGAMLGSEGSREKKKPRVSVTGP